MKTTGATSSHSQLFSLLSTEFTDVGRVNSLFEEFLQQEGFNRNFCHKLISIAKQGSGAAWDVKRLSVLMLENQVLQLDLERVDEFDWLLVALNLKQARGLDQAVSNSVLREGFSSTDFHRFVAELRRKLERLSRVHNKIKGRNTTEPALRAFIELSRRDCKLSLARYLFSPEETVKEILSHLQTTGGVKDLDPSQPRFVDEEVTAALKLLPDFERRILRSLCDSSNVYWVSDETSSKINSLVQYPATTVVLVIKPPGSDIEFEVKRAGRRGRNSLNVVYARNGYTVPPSHRLDGGCMQWMLRYESHSASKVSLIYRLVHGTQPPIASYVSRTTIYSVPVQSNEVQTIPYFTEPRFFGNGFRQMRVAMAESVAAFNTEGNADLPELPGPWGLSAQFIGHVQPAQSIVCGTSAFRLDRLAAYLSEAGPTRYFEKGLAVKFTKEDERRFADELLEEILGVYAPPGVNYQDYRTYLDAAFCVSENRARADRIYLSLVRQIASFWGTLLALRGFSRGESFVARNVGLSSFWENGQWDVRIIFMDHDALSIPGKDEQIFYVTGALPWMRVDERHIWDRSTPERFATSEVGYLQSIYRIGKEVDAEGQALANGELRNYYKKTQQALLTDSRLQSFFSKRFIERLLDWDVIINGYLNHQSSSVAWKKRMRKMLDAKGYKPVSLDCYLEFIEKNWDFLGKYAHLCEPLRESNRKQESDDELASLG